MREQIRIDRNRILTRTPSEDAREIALHERDPQVRLRRCFRTRIVRHLIERENEQERQNRLDGPHPAGHRKSRRRLLPRVLRGVTLDIVRSKLHGRTPRGEERTQHALGDGRQRAVHENHHRRKQEDATELRRRAKAHIHRDDAELIPRKTTEETRPHDLKARPQDRLRNDQGRQT